MKTCSRLLLGLWAIAWLAAASSWSQDAKKDGEVVLRWKVADGKTIAFKTALDPVEGGRDELIQIDIDALAQQKDLPAEIRKQLTSLKLPASASLVTLLKGLPNGNIAARVIVDKVSGDDKDSKLAELMKKMEGTVQLRGEITAAGEVASFYLESTQKNLLALFFELPKTPVKVGDTWPLHVNLVTMRGAFTADKASRQNRVRLASLSPTGDGDTVAVLEYHIAESVAGKFDNPMPGEKPIASAMAMSFIGQGEFLVTKGTWKKLVGRMHIQASGLLTSNAQKQCCLEPIDKVPEHLLKKE